MIESGTKKVQASGRFRVHAVARAASHFDESSVRASEDRGWRDFVLTSTERTHHDPQNPSDHTHTLGTQGDQRQTTTGRAPRGATRTTTSEQTKIAEAIVHHDFQNVSQIHNGSDSMVSDYSRFGPDGRPSETFGSMQKSIASWETDWPMPSVGEGGGEGRIRSFDWASKPGERRCCSTDRANHPSRNSGRV